MKRQPAWDPLAHVNKAVDSLLDPPAPREHTRDRPKSRGGRPRVDGRGRIVLYLDEQQIYKLKRAALEKRKDVSALAREVLRKAGY